MSSKAHRDILAEIADRKAWERSILRDALRGNLRVDPADAWFPGLEILERAGRLLKQGGAEPQGRSLSAALEAPERLSLIAEIKRASPSAGRIVSWQQPDELAIAYAEGGADAVSVLTDAHYFDGRPEFPARVRQVFPGPVLRKDFLVDEPDLAIASAMGCDAVLAIVSMLGAATRDFIRTARCYGLEVLVEVHDRRELDIAMASGSAIIGVNNRDLKTFRVDLSRTEELAELIPSPVLLVAESGMRSLHDAMRMRRAGADALLVGERLARTGGQGIADLRIEEPRGNRPL